MSFQRQVTIKLRSFAGTPTTPTVSPELAPTGTIQELSKAAHANGDTLTFNDGTNPATVFEYRVTAGSVGAGHVKVDASAATTAASVAAILIPLLLANGLRLSSAVDGGLGLITVTSSLPDEALPYTLSSSNGAETVTGMAAPTGATSYSYRVVDVQVDGTHTIRSAAGSTAAGAAALSALNLNRLSNVGVLPGFDHVDVFRTVGGATQGKIGTVTGVATTFDDVGLAGDATSPATSASGNLGISDSFQVGAFERHTTWVGPITGTWKVQVSGDAGATWFDAGSSVTNSGFFDTQLMATDARVVITAQSAGAPTGFARGLYSHEGG